MIEHLHWQDAESKTLNAKRLTRNAECETLNTNALIDKNYIMNQVQIIYVNMVNVTTGVMDINNKVWDSNVKVSAAVDNVKATIAEINSIAATQGQRTTGATSTKNDLWDTTAIEAEHICNGLKAYYDDTNDKTGYVVIDFCDTDFDSGNFSDAVSNMQIVQGVAAGLKIADLLPFQIVATEITGLQTSINTLIATAPANRVMKVSKKAATALLKVKHELLHKQMGKLDNLANTLKKGNPDFVTLYFYARRLIQTGKGHETEVLTLKPGEFVSLFGKEFTLKDTFTVRNTGSEIPIIVGITDTSTEMPTTNLISVGSKDEAKTVVGESFGGTLGHYLMIKNPSAFANASVTVLKAKG